MPEQSYSNHTKLVPLYHYFLLLLVLATFIGSLVNLYHSLGDHSRLYNASLITAMATALVLTSFFARTFALAAQDRAIRAEERFRHYTITGKSLDPRLNLRQIIALRFASDAEYPALAAKAANENMAPKEIKQAVKSWRADNDRL